MLLFIFINITYLEDNRIMSEILTDEQIALVKRYFKKLAELKNEEDDLFETWSDEKIACVMFPIYKRLIQPMDNNPERAALKHFETLNAVNKAVVLSGGDKASSAQH